MKILYVGTLPPHPGGSAVSASQILLGLAARGHEVRALASIESEALDYGQDDFARAHSDIQVHRFEVETHQVMTFLPPKSLPDGELARSQLVCLIRNCRPDVIFLGRESFAFGCVDVAYEAAIPTVLRVAGGTLAGIVSGTYSKTWSESWLEVASRVNLLITPARHMQSTLRQLGLERVRVIMNAVDLSQFEGDDDPQQLRREFAVREEDVVVASIANLHSRKRPFDVIDSAVLALRENPRLLYLLAGVGDLGPQLERSCRTAGIEDRVRQLGWVDQQRIPALLQLTEIVILASDAEGLARASLEAQAAGCVLIASDINASREVVADGENGILFPVGDVATLARRTLEVSSDPKLRRRLGRAAKKRMRSHSLEAAVAEYEAELEQVAGGFV